MQTFEAEYWNKNYSEPQTMDCIGNAKSHVQYLKSFFDLELIDISSIIDFGFGYGYLFQKMLKAFIPYKACGIEPSRFAYQKATKRKLRPVESTNLQLHNESIQSWCVKNEKTKVRYDLGICTSVFQYLSVEELRLILPVMSKKVKYLYLTVPTDKELEKQIDELNFHDTYALSRTREFYKKILNPHFTNISSKVWESKYHFNEETTLFSDLLYRN